MNKKWTDQKYIVHFILSVMVLTICGAVSYGIGCYQGEVDRNREAGLAKALAEVDERHIPYMASRQRIVEISLLSREEAEFPEQIDKTDDPTEKVVEAAGRNVRTTTSESVWEGRISADDYEALVRIVQAEAGNEDMKGKILVANVVLNRVADERFPGSVTEVVFQKSGGRAQFSPIANGTYDRVIVSDETREAVDRALAGEDYSEGALYFAARQYAGSVQMRWFDECLTKLFSYGGHEFFTS